MPERRSKRLAILGTGLIGASIGFAAREAGMAVTGWDPDARALRTALRRGAIGEAAPSMESAARTATSIMLAAPLDAIRSSLPAVIEAASDGALVMHCAGVMAPLNPLAVRLLKRRTAVRFAAAHPIAGSERSGAAFADGTLLKNHVMAIHAPRQRKRSAA